MVTRRLRCEGASLNLAARNHLISLLASWPDWRTARAWYLESFVPEIVANGATACRNEAERTHTRALQSLLGPTDWQHLGLILVQVEQQAQAELAPIWERFEQGQVARTEEALHAARRRDRWAAAARRASDAKAEQRRLKQEESRRRADLLRALHEQLIQDFLNVRTWLVRNDHERLIGASRFEAAASEHVTRWCTENLVIAGEQPFTPDGEQAAAIAAMGKHTLIKARAGSGKTATMVARAVSWSEAAASSPGRS